MGLLDSLLKSAPAIAQLVQKNPQLLNAALSLLSTRDASVGGTGGLAGLVTAFEQKGLGDMVSKWISTGPNPPVSASQVEDVLGSDVLNQFANKAGVPAAGAGGVLASILPSLIDQLTPEGKVPQGNGIDDVIGSLLGGPGNLGR